MFPSELTAAATAFGQLFLDARTAVLVVLLVVAAICDCRAHRIPNALVLAGAVFGVVYNTVLPPMPYNTILFPLGGLLVGFFLFMPLYLIRATGAGDVKLLAMIGAFLGPLATLHAALGAVLVGGALSILFVLAQGTLRRMISNIVLFVQLGLLGAVAGAPQVPRFSPDTTAGKLPYAVAIAIGTIGYLVLHQSGFA